MIRSELVTELATKTGIDLYKAEKVVLEIFACMTQTLASGGNVEIRGFGSFTVRECPERSGKNPKTGIKVVVKSKKKPFFKVGKDMKQRILDAGT